MLLWICRIMILRLLASLILVIRRSWTLYRARTSSRVLIPRFNRAAISGTIWTTSNDILSCSYFNFVFSNATCIYNYIVARAGAPAGVSPTLPKHLMGILFPSSPFVPSLQDHTVLSAIRHKWTYPAVTPVRGRYSIYLPRRDERLSWSRCPVTYRDGLPAHRRSPIQVPGLTRQCTAGSWTRDLLITSPMP